MRETHGREVVALSILKNKKRLPVLLAWCVLGAVVLLLLSGGSEKKEEAKQEEEKPSITAENYVETLEERLEKVLGNIENAGKVTVFLSMENTGKKILATDSKSKTLAEESFEMQKESQTETEESVVLSEKENGENPYIIEERLPVPSGILVIAEGAGDEKVRKEIYEAVKALFGLSANRIKVSY